MCHLEKKQHANIKIFSKTYKNVVQPLTLKQKIIIKINMAICPLCVVSFFLSFSVIHLHLPLQLSEGQCQIKVFKEDNNFSD